MADQHTDKLRVQTIDDLSVVSLRVAKSCLDDARERLDLAEPLRASGRDPRSLWLGPDRWLLVGSTDTPGILLDSCKQELTGILHHAVDYSSALSIQKVTGKNAWQLLASGTSIDLRPEYFRVGSCCRTRLAQVAAVIVADGTDAFSVHVDGSYAAYLAEWFAESINIYESRFN